jgi:hypothetical protein
VIDVGRLVSRVRRDRFEDLAVVVPGGVVVVAGVGVTWLVTIAGFLGVNRSVESFPNSSPSVVRCHGRVVRMALCPIVVTFLGGVSGRLCGRLGGVGGLGGLLGVLGRLGGVCAGWEVVSERLGQLGVGHRDGGGGGSFGGRTIGGDGLGHDPLHVLGRHVCHAHTIGGRPRNLSIRARGVIARADFAPSGLSWRRPLDLGAAP